MVSDGGSQGDGPSVSSGLPCSGAELFCDDFESYADVSLPGAPKWKSWTVGTGKLMVDGAQHFSGSKAVHVHGQVSQAGSSKAQAFMLAQGAGFPVAGKTLFLRFMMYGTRMPFTGFSGANHTVLAWVGSTNALSSPDRGATDEALMLADYNGISIEPMWSGYYRDTTRSFQDANLASKWHCWEVEIDTASGPPAGATGPSLPHIWIDGSELKLTAKGGNYAAVPFQAIMLGMWSPQTDSSAADFWYDDVAVAKTRLNCPGAK